MSGSAGACLGNELDYAAVHVRQTDHPALQAARKAGTNLNFFFVCVGSREKAGRAISPLQALQTGLNALSVNAPNGIDFLVRNKAHAMQKPATIYVDLGVEISLPARRYATTEFCLWNGPRRFIPKLEHGMFDLLRAIKSPSTEQDKRFLHHGYCKPTQEMITMLAAEGCEDKDRLGCDLQHMSRITLTNALVFPCNQQGIWQLSSCTFPPAHTCS